MRKIHSEIIIFYGVKLVIITAILLLAGACVPRKEVNLELTDKLVFTPKRDAKVQLDMVINAENQNAHPILLRDFHFDTWQHGQELGTIDLRHPIKLPAKYHDTLTIPFEIQFVSYGRMFKFMLSKGYESWQDMEIEGYVKAKYRITSFKHKVDKQPIKQAISDLPVTIPYR